MTFHTWNANILPCLIASIRTGGIVISLLELLGIAVGLSMDAFAVAICIGLTLQKPRLIHALTVGGYFGFFQFLMPLSGYLLAERFSTYLTRIAPYLAFGLLSVIGGNMIRESFLADEEQTDSFSPKVMLPLAIATSIDALATGVAFAALSVSILPSVILIGCTTFVISFAGLYLGHAFGQRMQTHAQRLGGIILILIGLKILLEHFL